MNINIIDDNKKLEFKDEFINLKLESNSSNKDKDIYINGTVNMFLILNSDMKLNLYINKYSTLNLNNYINVSNSKIDININFLGEYSNINYNSSIVGNITKKIEINHNYNNTNSNVNIRGINNKNSIKLTMIEKVEKNIKNCNIIENSKIINILDSKSYVEPILLIKSNEVSASHSSIIKNIDLNYIEYFKSRGIKEENSIELISDGFLLEFFDNDQKTYIKEKNYEY